jgi:beta-galactosidase
MFSIKSNVEQKCSNRSKTLFLWLVVIMSFLSPNVCHAAEPKHTFVISDRDFLLDGKPLQIRCGEIHMARVPREYWQHRLRQCKAMGLNAVCAYLFWNYHEWEQGKFNWSGQADAAEFCRMAQAEGLWVVLRPGPYACAEWEMGGLPWWLLKDDNVVLRSRDAKFISAARNWLKEVGRVLGPLQVTKGGPILMVQVENEYGFYGKDAKYMGEIKQSLLDAGFEVPLFACSPPSAMRNGYRPDLFMVVNFGKAPASSFKALREIQPTGPLMCGEFYPGWFDTWGYPHHKGDTAQYIRDLQYMLENNASFSIYMAHGGTTFGLWSGNDRPFKPDTSSYDYDAPISEAGWVGEKFKQTRELMSRHLLPGETLPEPAPANPVITIAPFDLTESAEMLDNLPTPIEDKEPKTMELYNQGRGCILYRTTIPAGPEATLKVKRANDFAWIFVNGKQVGIMDRRYNRYQVNIPARTVPARLDILIEAVGRINFGQEMHDRKGLHGPVQLIVDNQSAAIENWQVYCFDLENKMLAGLKWKPGKANGPAFWRGSFTVDKIGDTFLDVSSWGKGVVWVNGHCMGRFWNIGPTQTMYVPGPWLKSGTNEVIVLDMLGPQKATLAGVTEPVLDTLRPQLDFSSKKMEYQVKLKLEGIKPVHSGSFTEDARAQEVKFAQPAVGRQFCIETLSALDGKPSAAIAELDLIFPDGKNVSHANWTIVYVDSEEITAEDGSAMNAINGQTADFWHTEWSATQPNHPHYLIIDMGDSITIGGFRYTPRQGDAGVGGRIKDYRIYVGDALAK